MKTYQQLASVTGQKWWIVRNRAVGERILTHLKNNGLEIGSVPDGPIKRKRNKISQYRGELSGMDHMYTASELYTAVDSGEVLTDE